MEKNEPIDLNIQIVQAADIVVEDDRGPTIGEQLRVRKVGYLDETTDPGEDKRAFDHPTNFVMFVKNMRGFQKGHKGRRIDGAYLDGMVIHNMPKFLPFSEVEEFCGEMMRLAKAGREVCDKANK